MSGRCDLTQSRSSVVQWRFNTPINVNQKCASSVVRSAPSGKNRWCVTQRFLLHLMTTKLLSIWRAGLRGVGRISFCVWDHWRIPITNETWWCMSHLDTTFAIIYSITEIPYIYLTGLVIRRLSTRVSTKRLLSVLRGILMRNTLDSHCRNCQRDDPQHG